MTKQEPKVYENWTEIGGHAGLSNFDFCVDDGIEDELRAGGVWTRYAAHNFNGCVWFADGQFHCEVWVYNAPRSTISNPEIMGLMHAVSEEYGYD